MESHFFTSELTRLNGYVKRTVYLVGNISGQSALDIKNNIGDWYQEPLDDLVFDLRKTKEFDLLGVNTLVQFKMIALQKGIGFQIIAPYREKFVDFFSKTKLTERLNVKFVYGTARQVSDAA